MTAEKVNIPDMNSSDISYIERHIRINEDLLKMGLPGLKKTKRTRDLLKIYEVKFMHFRFIGSFASKNIETNGLRKTWAS